MTKEVEIDGKRLERLKAMVIQCFTDEMITDVEVHPEFLDRMVRVRTRVSLFGLLSDVEQVPLNWVQAFRQRWFSATWLSDHPVKMREIRVYGAVYLRPSDDPFWKER